MDRLSAHELELDPSRGPGIGGRVGRGPAGCHTHAGSCSAPFLAHAVCCCCLNEVCCLMVDLNKLHKVTLQYACTTIMSVCELAFYLKAIRRTRILELYCGHIVCPHAVADQFKKVRDRKVVISGRGDQNKRGGDITGQGRAGQGRAGQGRAGQGRAGQGSTIARIA